MRNAYQFDFSCLAASNNEDYFWVDDRQVSTAFGLKLPPRVADLVDVAMAVYSADRGAARVRNLSTSVGSRRFEIRLGLRNPDLWRDSLVLETLRRTLAWFTDDDWRFEFLRREGAPRASERTDFLFASPPKKPSATCLFSGGLDSLAGLAPYLFSGKYASLVLVSGCTNHRLADTQRNAIRGLRSLYQSATLDIRSVIVPFGIGNPPTASKESSQRSRGFVFMVLGAAAMLMAESEGLTILENGVGAINLPMTQAQIGVDNARGVHPLSLCCMRKLLGRVLDRKVSIANPCQLMTKGEMCRQVAEMGLGNLAQETVSCDGFPIRVRGKAQCGTCTSCLLRRVALHAAGLERSDSGSLYLYDVRRPSQIPEDRRYPVQAMLDQVDRIDECLSSANSWRRLAHEFPELMEVHASLASLDGPSNAQIADALVRMYGAYVQEWRGFAGTFSRS